MSSPRRSEPGESGFTLLECLVAVLVLSLLATGLAKLTVHHDRIVADLESWTDGDPTWYVTQVDDDLARLVGVPATLSADPPPPLSPPPGPGAFAVTVSDVELQLDPPAASARAHLQEL